jgi:hypothetical protein
MHSSQRDRRLLRVAESVLVRYRFTRRPEAAAGVHRDAGGAERDRDAGDVIRFDVTGGTQPYVVTLSRSWAKAPSCTCPDANRDGVGGYCKHTMALMLREPEFQCQLLELFL